MASDKYGLADIKQEKADSNAFKNNLRESLNKSDNSVQGDKPSQEQSSEMTNSSSEDKSPIVEKPTPSLKDSSKSPVSAPASSAPALFEVGDKKFKTWDEAKVEVMNLHKLRGNQANEVKQRRDAEAKLQARVDELEKGEVAQFVNQYKQYPDLQKEVLEAYARWRQLKAGGATNTQATNATGFSPDLVRELATKAFKEEAQKLQQAYATAQQKADEEKAVKMQEAQHASRIDDEEKELRAAYPDLDNDTWIACCKVASRFTNAVDPDTGEPKPMTLLEAREWLDFQTKGKKPPAEAKEETPKGANSNPKPRDLSETDNNGKARNSQAKKNIADILKRSRELERSENKG